MTVAIVNRKFATHFFGDKSPLGRHVGFGDGPKSKLDIEIVGVTEDSLYEGPREGVHRQVFVPFIAVRLPCRRGVLRADVDGFEEHVRGAAAQGAGNSIAACRSTR